MSTPESEFITAIFEDALLGLNNPKRVMQVWKAELFSKDVQTRFYHAWLVGLLFWIEEGSLCDLLSDHTEAPKEKVQEYFRERISDTLARIDGGWNPFGEKPPQGEECRQCKFIVTVRNRLANNPSCTLCQGNAPRRKP